MKNVDELERDLEREKDIYCLLETVAPRDGLPEIPEEYKEKLEETYHRYEHFIDITSGEFSPSEIEEDRQKYSHLLLPEENELPVFDDEKCMEYMHIISRVPKIYCAVYIYEQDIDLVASGIISGSPVENLQELYLNTLRLIKNIEE